VLVLSTEYDRSSTTSTECDLSQVAHSSAEFLVWLHLVFVRDPRPAACLQTATMSKRRKLGKSAEPAVSTVGSASESPIPTICVLGATGVGKGSTLNSCFRTDRFGTSGQLDSDTVRPVSFVLPWRGNGALMRGVDLCGFSDSEGRDTGFIEAMVDYLRTEVESVNCFLLLLNSQEPRIGMHLKDMLLALRSVFGLPFLSHVIIGFTRWDDSAKGAPC